MDACVVPIPSFARARGVNHITRPCPNRGVSFLKREPRAHIHLTTSGMTATRSSQEKTAEKHCSRKALPIIVLLEPWLPHHDLRPSPSFLLQPLCSETLIPFKPGVCCVAHSEAPLRRAELVSATNRSRVMRGQRRLMDAPTEEAYARRAEKERSA